MTALLTHYRNSESRTASVCGQLKTSNFIGMNRLRDCLRLWQTGMSTLWHAPVISGFGPLNGSWLVGVFAGLKTLQTRVCQRGRTRSFFFWPPTMLRQSHPSGLVFGLLVFARECNSDTLIGRWEDAATRSTSLTPSSGCAQRRKLCTDRSGSASHYSVPLLVKAFTRFAKTPFHVLVCVCVFCGPGGLVIVLEQSGVSASQRSVRNRHKQEAQGEIEAVSWHSEQLSGLKEEEADRKQLWKPSRAAGAPERARKGERESRSALFVCVTWGDARSPFVSIPHPPSWIEEHLRKHSTTGSSLLQILHYCTSFSMWGFVFLKTLLHVLHLDTKIFAFHSLYEKNMLVTFAFKNYWKDRNLINSSSPMLLCYIKWYVLL